MHLLRRWLLLTGILLPVLACDDYSHDGVVNTPPVNFVLLSQQLTFGGPNHDWATALTPLGSGHWLLAGATDSWGYGPTTLYAVRVDAAGDVAWHTWQGGWGEDRAAAVAVDAGGNILVTGTTASFDLETGQVIDPNSGKPTDDRNVYLVKVDAAGQLLWHHAYGDTLYAEAAVGVMTLADGYLAAGQQARGEDDRDIFLVRTEVNGDLRWQKLIASAEIESITCAIPTYDGGMALAGSVKDDFQSDDDACVWKVDVAGNIVWQQRIADTTTSTVLHGLVEGSNHDLLVTGRSRLAPFSDPAGDALYVARISAAGIRQWEGRYPGSSVREGRAVCESGAGALFVCGQQMTDNAIMLCKLLADGTLTWSDSTHADGYGMAMAPISGGFVITGSTAYPDKRELNDMLLIAVQEDLTNIK